MKVLQNLALLVAAICIAKVLFTAIGLLIVLIPMALQLPVAESALRYVYLVVIGYCSIVVTISVPTGLAIYMQATYRDAWRLKLLTLATFCLYGSHVIYASAISPSDEMLMRFARGFIWMPAVAVLAIAVLLTISWFRKRVTRATQA